MFLHIAHAKLGNLSFINECFLGGLRGYDRRLLRHVLRLDFHYLEGFFTFVPYLFFFNLSNPVIYCD